MKRLYACVNDCPPDEQSVDLKTLVLNENQIEKVLLKFEGKTEFNDEEILREMAGVFQQCYHVFMTNRDRLSEAVEASAGWLTEPEVMVQIVRTFDTETLLGLALLTSVLERSLGDLLGRNTVPSLLRDLLKAEELEKTFGWPLMALTRILMGTPQSLNIRNVVWHGFASEFNANLLATLVVLVHSMSRHLRGQERVCHRPTVSFQPIRNMYNVLDPQNDFGELKSLRSDNAELNNMLTGFDRILGDVQAHYQAGEFRNSLVLLVLMWEPILRCRFVEWNDCAERLLTAESDEFYTTFDTFLKRDFGKERNRLPERLGRDHAELLFDLLVLPRGPRLRDKLSHGEIGNNGDSEREHFKMACDVVLVSIREAIRPNPGFRYATQYHPLTLLKEETADALETVKNLYDAKFWRDDAVPEVPPSPPLTAYVRPDTLYRDKSDYALLHLMRSVVKQIQNGGDGIRDNLRSKLQDYQSGKLRSRQRATYDRMLQVVPVVLKTFLDILNQFRVYVNAHGSRTPPWTSKQLRKLLKLGENIAIYASVSKNRWEETNDAIKTDFSSEFLVY